MLIFNKHFCIVKILTSAETEGTWVINFLRTKTLKVKAVLSHFFSIMVSGFPVLLRSFPQSDDSILLLSFSNGFHN